MSTALRTWGSGHRTGGIPRGGNYIHAPSRSIFLQVAIILTARGLLEYLPNASPQQSPSAEANPQIPLDTRSCGSSQFCT